MIRVAIAGTGNVASRLAPACAAAGLNVVCIYGRDIAKARCLAETVSLADANYFRAPVAVDNPSDIPHDVDLCIIAVSDRAISSLGASLSHINGVLAHTSGSMPLDIFAGHPGGAGVIYPLQTFTATRELDFKTIPLYIEADSKHSLALIEQAARALSHTVRKATSDRRRHLHIAGVMACNFVNAILGMAERQVLTAGGKRDDLRPLVEETVAKFFSLGPEKAQTGPAARGDMEVVSRHMTMLDNEVSKNVYGTISRLISNNSNHHEQDKL